MAIIGIDLGTTNSEVAVFRSGQAVLVKNEYSEDITPSVIALNENKVLSFGKSAKEAHKDFAKEFKRRMGTDETTRLGDQEYNAIELSSLFLKHLKSYAEDYLSEKVDRAVITIPANFTESQRNATIRAGEMAGFKVERIIHEPTAAALAYGHSNPQLNGKILVYDLGGGTFDVTILDYLPKFCDVIGSSGDTKLGGVDFDKQLMNHIIREIEKKDGVKIDLNDTSTDGLKRKRRLELATEKAKIELSFQPQVRVDLPFFTIHHGVPYSIELEVQRSIFDNLIEKDVDRTFKCIDKALYNAKLTAEDISYVILIGGSTRIPLVRERIIAKFGENNVLRNIDPDRAVAVGASIQAAILDNTDIPLGISDVVPHSIGTAVAQWINGQLVSGFFSEIIPANAPMLKEFSGQYFTLHDYQESIEVNVYQKSSMVESIFVDDMEVLNPDNPLDANLNNIPPAPAGEQSVTVTFSYNQNGTVNVRAILDSTGAAIAFSAKKTYRNETDSELVDEVWETSGVAKQVQILLNMIENKLPSLTPEQQTKLNDMVSKLKHAAAHNDLNEVTRIDDEINEYLFEIG